MYWYSGGSTTWWKNRWAIFSCFNALPACDRQTDRQTDGRTDTDILRQHSPRCAYVSRGKNVYCNSLVRVVYRSTLLSPVCREQELKNCYIRLYWDSDTVYWRVAGDWRAWRQTRRAGGRLDTTERRTDVYTTGDHRLLQRKGKSSRHLVCLQLLTVRITCAVGPYRI